MTREQKEILREHLPYEICMLRYTFGAVDKPREQLDWNAHLESFAIHARALVEFFLNEDDRHNRTMIAKDLVPGWTAPEKNEIDRFITKVNQQVAHLGSSRTRRAAEKIGPERARKALDWIEAAVVQYRDGMSKEARSLFNEAACTPVPGGASVILTTTTTSLQGETIGFRRLEK